MRIELSALCQKEWSDGMKTGFIYHLNNRYFSLAIWVKGYPEYAYNGYSVKDAVKEYRNRYGLVGKRISFTEIENDTRNLYTSVK